METIKDKLLDAMISHYNGVPFVGAKNTKDECSENIPLSEVEKYVFVKMNNSKIKVVQFDVDIECLDEGIPYCEGMDRVFYDNYGIQVPNYAIHTTNGKFQFGYILSNSLPVFGNCSKASSSYLRDIRMKINIAIGGDRAFNQRGWARNPLYSGAHVRFFHETFYNLEDLDIKMKLPSKGAISGGQVAYFEGNRNNATTHYCIRLVKEHCEIDEYSMLAHVEQFQKEYIDVKPLSEIENERIIRSVLRNGKNYRAWNAKPHWKIGACQLPEIDWSELNKAEREDEISNRKRIGAFHCHNVVKNNMLNELKKCAFEMKAKEIYITKKGLSKYANVSKNTVKKYWDDIFGEVA